jgi:hypothetical protein
MVETTAEDIDGGPSSSRSDHLGRQPEAPLLVRHENPRLTLSPIKLFLPKMASRAALETPKS